MDAEEADEEIIGWLADPPKYTPKLTLRGAPGAGKTALLEQLHEQLPGSLFLDCRGLSAHQVLSRLLAHFELKPVRRQFGEPLRDTLAGLRRGGIVILANVQWAGTLFSSTEPRLIHRLIGEFSSRGRGHVLPVLEAGEATDPTQADRPNEVLLEKEPEESPAEQLLTAHPALRAMASIELRAVPLPVWRFIDMALGGTHTEAMLLGTAERLPAVLHMEAGSDGTPTVRLASDGLKHILRTAEPITAAEQSQITDALIDAASRDIDTAPDSSVVDYAGQALAIHAALAGTLPGLLEDQPVVAATADRVSLQHAIRLAWPGGPPVGGVAADAHYLDGDGVTPDSHGEWLAWLHWAAMNRGAHGWADRLESAGPVRLAWRTAWSKWRPYGVMGPRPDLPGPTDGAEISTYEDVPVVATEHSGVCSEQEIEAALPDGLDEWGDDVVLERVWRLLDGHEVIEPRVVHQFFGDEGDVDRRAGSALDARRSDSSTESSRDWPGLLMAQCGTIEASEGRWVAYGPRGIYAFDVLESEHVGTGPGYWQRSLVPSPRSTSLWPMPTAVSERGPALKAWFTTAFGSDALRSLPPSELPEGLADPGTRRLLSETGLPFLSEDTPAFLTTVALDRSGLEPFDRLEDAFLLGHWLAEPIALKGKTGEVLFVSEAGSELLGSSLRQFMTLVGLYRQLALSGFTPGDDQGLDARRSVKAWAQEIDSKAAASRSWQAALGGHLDHL